jgi:hypothetical protein
LPHPSAESSIEVEKEAALRRATGTVYRITRGFFRTGMPRRRCGNPVDAQTVLNP